MRGTREQKAYWGDWTRFIPARAGNTSRTSATPPGASVHPRPCGEHASVPAVDPNTTGSSPPVRGTPAPVHGSDLLHRFIPARAGNTPSRAARDPPGAVHPRPCGEHAVSDANAVSGAGSSPPVRGTRRLPRWRPYQVRFIPARAGNTLAATMWLYLSSVHPRPCGEHSRRQCEQSGAGGSSPPVRGTLSFGLLSR